MTNDLIKRQDAIDAIEQAMINHDSAIMRVVDLPSAQRTGEWIVGTDTGCQMYECSACGGRMTKDYYDKAVGTQGFNYCPYCGSHNGSEL